MQDTNRATTLDGSPAGMQQQNHTTTGRFTEKGRPRRDKEKFREIIKSKELTKRPYPKPTLTKHPTGKHYPYPHHRPDTATYNWGIKIEGGAKLG